ncbi:MAG: TIGR02569 family protein [Gaiellales bacterium]
MISRPGPEVLAAFGVPRAVSRPLPGGQGTTWMAGDVVLKPVSSVVEAEWVGSILCYLRERGCRVSRPIRSSAGTWTAQGWAAWEIVDGGHDFSSRWPDVLAAGAAFHTTLRDITRPAFLDARDDVWSVGDRAAWDDAPPGVIHDAFGPVAEQLAAVRSPSRLPSQVVHGDLTGNVLFADGADPAIIDFVPYWRPVEFASAIVVADAIAWHKAGSDLARSLPSVEDPRSMLARAAIYRLITSDRTAAGRTEGKAKYLRDNVEANYRVLSAVRAM